jgi:hypothetical protein
MESGGLYRGDRGRMQMKTSAHTVRPTGRGRVATRALLLPALLLGLRCAVAASFVSGADLLEDCREVGGTSYQGVAQGTCVGYLMAIFESHGTYVDNALMDPLWCPPEDLSSIELAQAARAYLDAYPDKLEKAADSLVMNAFMREWPCKTASKGEAPGARTFEDAVREYCSKELPYESRLCAERKRRATSN